MVMVLVVVVVVVVIVVVGYWINLCHRLMEDWMDLLQWLNLLEDGWIVLLLLLALLVLLAV